MTRKTKSGLIILLTTIMIIFSPILISSISGAAHLNGLKYLIDNGRLVDGEVTRFTKADYQSTTDGYIRVVFKLYYEYEENGTTWFTYKWWQIRKDKSEQVEERETWCQAQIGKSVKLIIADNGYCEINDEVNAVYKEQYDYVYVRGGIMAGFEVLLLIGIIVVVFYKKPKEKKCAFIEN